ncbi:MAG TPA: hypothetical protein PLC80_06420 [Draconibacterium sp.]|nr:hypothetical protein [Draconibacterium sp.]
MITIDINQATLDETFNLAGNRKDHVKTFQLDITDKATVISTVFFHH